MTLRLPLSRVLLSDYSNWHWVLSHGYYSRDDEHQPECWRAEPSPCDVCRASNDWYAVVGHLYPGWRRDYRIIPPHLRRPLEGSWERAAFTFSGGPVQATFEYVDLSEVVRVVRVDPDRPTPPRDGFSLPYTTAAKINHPPSFIEVPGRV